MKTTIKIISGITLCSGILFLAQSCIDSKGEERKIPRTSEPIPVKTIVLEKSISQGHVITSGQLTTDDETTLSFKTGGIVESVFVKEGDKVSAGQILAVLDLTEINALTTQAKLGLDKAERDLKRVKNLYADSVATLEQLQNSETAFELAKAQYNSANFNRTYSQIKAPHSGYVLRKFVNPGQVVGVGDPVLRTNGAGKGEWILKTGVSDKQWAVINTADKATITVDAISGKTFDGVVTRKSETADPSSGAFTIEIKLKAQDAKLATGMFAAANITVSQKSHSWQVPFEAVLDADGSEGFVFITNDDKTALKIPVTIESFNPGAIVIRSGLENARALIISGSAYLNDRSPISIVK